MFDKRLFREVQAIRFYWQKTTTVALTVVVFTVLQNRQLAVLLDQVISLAAPWNLILRLLGLWLLWILLKTGSALVYEQMNRTSGLRLKDWIRQRLTASLLARGPVRLKSEQAAVLATVLQEGLDSVEPYYAEFIPQLVFVVVNTPVILGVVIAHDWLSGLIMAVTAPLIPLFMTLIGKLAQARNLRQWQTMQQMSGHFLDVLRGQKTLRLFGRQQFQASVICQVNENFRQATNSVLRISFLSALMLELTATLSTAVVAVSLGVRLIYGQLNFLDAFFVLLMAPEFYQPLRQLGAKFHAAIGSRTSADTIYQYLATGPVSGTQPAAPTAQPAGADPVSGSRSAAWTAGGVRVEIRDLTFAYEGNPTVIRGLNLTILPGQHIALAGATGSGKSTLAALIMGFILPQSGSIEIAGQPVTHFGAAAHRDCYAYVPQRPQLFRDTLWNNLVLGCPQASESQVLAVLAAVGLAELPASLPQGLATLVGEGGRQLSGGQIQRLGIARAMLKDAPLLILDEPTSALDLETEQIIHTALQKHRRGRTVLTIAHRVATLQQADLICILDHGMIAEQGPPELLSQQDGF